MSRGSKSYLIDAEGDAFMLPPGMLPWSGILVSGTVRCKAKYQRQDPNSHQFLGNWIFHLSGWQLLPTTPIPADRLALFLDALISLRDEGVLSHPLLNPLPATPPPTRSERRR